jgi:putative ABC transport system ATP-binding protein
MNNEKHQPNAIETKNLKKIFGKKSSRFEALKGINIAVKEGESVAIVGKSGSGKSTLMHLLALLDKPTSGAVLVGGKNATSLDEKALNELRNVKFGFVFQQFFMNDNDSVLNNVILPLKIAGVSRHERKERAMEALRTVELEEKAHTKAVNLSGGQKQRVCIARALINNPTIIFADEPTGNLDSGTSDKVEDLLFSLNRDKGITLIIVTHDPDLAQRCGRRIHIKDGLQVFDTDSDRADARAAKKQEHAAANHSAEKGAK